MRNFPLPEAANEHSTNMGIDDPLRALSRYVACLIHPKVIPSIADISIKQFMRLKFETAGLSCNPNVREGEKYLCVEKNW